MTDYRDSTTQSRFEAALVNYEAARAAAASVEACSACHARDQIFTVLDDSFNALMNAPAPALTAIATKLQSLFGEALFNQSDYRSDWPRRLIGDIRRIEALRLGVEEPDASGGMDLSRIARDWTAALQEYSRLELLLKDGHSGTWSESKRDELVARLDDAEAELLSRHAPHLDAVIKKLELLTEAHSEPIDESAAHVLILRDLRRFAIASCR